MKDKINQLFKDKVILVMLVLGLLTIVTAAGIVSMRKGSKTPLEEIQEQGNEYIDAETQKEEYLDLAGNSNAQEITGETSEVLSEEEKTQNVSGNENQWKAGNEGIADEQAAGKTDGKQTDSEHVNAKTVKLDFADTESLAWPIHGNVIQMYSMDTTVYFPTLDQYKCSSGIALSGEVSTPVAAPANVMVMEVGSNEEIGNYVNLDLGNSYTLLCGQLKDIQVTQGQYLEKGQVMGYVAEPTKYYSIEGSNVYLELLKDGKPIDPLDYLE